MLKKQGYKDIRYYILTCCPFSPSPPSLPFAQLAPFAPYEPRQACSSHHQISFLDLFCFSICQTQRKYQQIQWRHAVYIDPSMNHHSTLLFSQPAPLPLSRTKFNGECVQANQTFLHGFVHTFAINVIFRMRKRDKVVGVVGSVCRAAFSHMSDSGMPHGSAWEQLAREICQSQDWIKYR